jgi:large subunit ribosomal protein L10
VRAGIVAGEQVLDPEGVKALSAMPSLPELRSRLLGVLMAPAGKLVRLLSTPASHMVRVMKAHHDKQEGN